MTNTLDVRVFCRHAVWPKAAAADGRMYDFDKVYHERNLQKISTLASSVSSRRRLRIPATASGTSAAG
jgi:hypothetical protein